MKSVWVKLKTIEVEDHTTRKFFRLFEDSDGTVLITVEVDYAGEPQRLGLLRQNGPLWLSDMIFDQVYPLIAGEVMEALEAVENR